VKVAVVYVAAVTGALREVESEINVAAAGAVAQALERGGHRAWLVPVADAGDLERGLAGGRFGAAFNLCESLAGDPAREIEAARRTAALVPRVTGCPPDVLALTLDKPAVKSRLAALGVPTPAGVTIEAGASMVVALAAVRDLPHPVVVKPAREDGSIGVATAGFAETPEESALAALALCERLGGGVLVERYLPGRELHVFAAGGAGVPEIFLFSEIVYDRAAGDPCLYTYEAKWKEGAPEWWGTDIVHAPAIEPALASGLRQLATKAWSALGLSGYARLDTRLDQAGVPHVLEVNSNPDLSPSEGIAEAFEHAGFRFDDFVARQLDWAWSAPRA
jgi:D-alanine-D-alanine ligase